MRRREKTGDEARAETLQLKSGNVEERVVYERKTDMVEDFREIIEEYKPGLIAVSIVETTYFIALKLLNAIKDYNIPKSIGGIHVMNAPEDVIKEECVDIACIGEGEVPLVELANRIEKGQDYSDIPSLWVKKDGKVIRNLVGPLVNLDELPDQDWTIFGKEYLYKPMGGKVWVCGHIELDRGCPFKCAFCCNDKLQKIYKGQGYYPRRRSIKKFMDEFKDKLNTYNLNYLYVGSEHFYQGEKRFNEFIDAYREIKIPFWIETRPETVNEYMIEKLEEVGCEGISVGVEHGNDEFRRKILNRFVPNEVMIKAFRIMMESEIRITANNIVGYPDETRELFFDTVELNRQLKSKYYMVNIFAPHRGTRLWEICVEKGYISRDAIAGDYRMDSGMDMPKLSREAIRGLQRTFPLYVKLPKNMWSEIKIAEKFDDEGNAAFEKLSEIYREKYV